MERIEELCAYYVAMLRCVYLVHQNHHWITNGENFYGNHLLFERIYKSATEDADLAAEKFVGLFGLDCLDTKMQAHMIGKILETFAGGDPIEGSLEAEEKFLTLSQKIYDTLKKEGKLSLGLDDMIMAIASNREGAIYLLRQANSQKNEEETGNSRKIAARKRLLKRLAQDPMADERNALTTLKQNISSILAKLTKGKITSFKLSAERAGGDLSKYKFTIIFPQGSPEAEIKNEFEKVFVPIAESVPLFKGKVESTKVLIA